MPKPLLSIQDLATYLNVPVQTIYKWNTRGTGPRYVRAGRFLRWRQEEVDRWLEQGQPNG